VSHSLLGLPAKRCKYRVVKGRLVVGQNSPVLFFAGASANGGAAIQLLEAGCAGERNLRPGH